MIESLASDPIVPAETETIAVTYPRGVPKLARYRARTGRLETHFFTQNIAKLFFFGTSMDRRE
jgi:hypothetical protein